MDLRPISQCIRDLDFEPRKSWPTAFPAISWNGHLVCGFNRVDGTALEMDEKSANHFLDLWQACHPVLGLAEIARVVRALSRVWPELFLEWREPLLQIYQLRWSDRLEQTLHTLCQLPKAYQNWIDDKKVGPRELSPLLALPDVHALDPFFNEIPKMVISRHEGARALELIVELYLMGRPLNDLLPTSDNGSLYVRRLESWRRPQTEERDETWRRSVNTWPWPAQVEAEWQRFGDQSGLEVKIRTTSPDDLQKKLERLLTIPDTWSCTKN